jgi:hypothetical protein
MNGPITNDEAALMLLLIHDRLTTLTATGEAHE